jgi:hypothetical protein
MLRVSGLKNSARLPCFETLIVRQVLRPLLGRKAGTFPKVSDVSQETDVCET